MCVFLFQMVLGGGPAGMPPAWLTAVSNECPTLPETLTAAGRRVLNLRLKLIKSLTAADAHGHILESIPFTFLHEKASWRKGHGLVQAVNRECRAIALWR